MAKRLSGDSKSNSVPQVQQTSANLTESEKALPLPDLIWVRETQSVDFRFPHLANLECEIKGNAKVNSAVAFEQALFDNRYVINKVHRQFRVERDFGDEKLLTQAGQVLHDLFGSKAIACLNYMFWDIRMCEHFILHKLKLHDQLLSCTAEGLAAALKTRDLDHMSFVNPKKKPSVENAAFNAFFVLKNQRSIPDSDLL